MTDYNTHDATFEQTATVTNDTPQVAPKKIHIDRNDGDEVNAAYPDDEFGFYCEDQFEETYQRLIKDDLRRAREDYNLRKLENLTDENLRGIWFDTWRHWHCGYLENWILTKSRAEWKCGTYVDKETGERKHLPPPSRRIIVPTPSMNHFNAIALATDRKTMDKKFWKQHAGEKELFYDKTLHKAKIALGFEGEVDAMSVWQACCFKISEPEFSPVAILGCSNWKKTLLPNLGTLLRGKKILLVLDGDESGRKNAAELRKGLIQRRTPTVTKFLYDALSEADQKLFGIKVDANDLLIKRGEEFLRDLINKIVAEAQVEFDAAQQEIDSQNLFANRDDRQSQPSQPKKSVTEADKPTVTNLLKFVKARNLSREEWLSVGIIMKYAGFTLDDFKKWSDDGDYRYSAETCSREWNTVKPAAQLGDDKGYTLGTLVKLAKQGGYAPPHEKKTPTADDFKTGNADADAWQKANGIFDKQLYLEIRAAEKFLQELTPETLTATVASSSTAARKIALCTVYDFALEAAQKFWLRLEDAIANAVAQVKTAKTTGGEFVTIPDNVRLLAQLTVNGVRKTVDREVKAVQRAHEKFQVEAKAKQQAKATKARLDNYMQNAPTTRKVIDDCPVDLIIPPDVYFGQEVGLQVILPNGTVSQRPAALAPVTVTKKFRNESTGGVMFEIAIKTCDAWRRHEVDGKSLQSARSVDVLGNFGLPIEDAGALAKFFARIIAANDKTLTVTKVFTQTGWTDDDSTDFVYPSQDADYCVRRAGFDFAKELACRGDVDTWTKTFVDAMKAGGSKARVYVGTALAAPLIRKFNIPNLQTHLHGTSGSGKTALEKLTASILGNPRLLIRTFEATPKNRQAVAAAFNDLPMFLDELGTINGKKGEDALSQSIYAYSLGNQNQAQQRNGDTRPLVKFYGSRLSTGERAILKNHDARGNFKRLLEIQCDKMFDDRVAAELHLVAEKNFGHFGRKWIEHVTKHVDEICAQFDDYAVIFTGGHNQREPTLIKAVVAAAVAFQHFMICAGAQDEFDEATCENDAGTIIETLPTLDDMSDDVRAIAALKSFVAAHPKHFMFESEDDTQTISDTTVWATPTFGKHFSDGRVAFLPTELQKILEDELGFASKDALVDAWHRKGLLVTNGNRRDYRITLGKTRPATICFKQSVLSEGYEPRTVYAPPIISSAQNETD